MDIDDKEFENPLPTNAVSSSHRSRQSSSVDLENLITGLRQDTRGSSRAFHEERSTASKKKDLEGLKSLWVAERVSPELLPFDEALLDRIMARVRDQVGRVLLRINFLAN